MRRTSGKHEICESNLEEALAACPETYGHLDLIAFGFPCQDISIANPNGKGIEGEKSSLFFEAIRIVRLLMPKWILIENVPGLLSSNEGKDFGIVLHEMAESGYGCCWNVLDSQWFGVPQRRRRLFIAGCFGRVCPCEILSEPAGHQRNVQKDDEAPSASHCINARTGSRQGSSVETYIAKTVNTGQRGNNCAWRENYVGKTMQAEQHGRNQDSQIIASTITQNSGIHNARNDTLIARNDTLIDRTINTRDGAGTCEATQENYIAEPDSDGKGKVAGPARGLDTARGIVIGNAITVPVIEWIGKRIIDYENN